MKLYYSPGACSLASHIALQETGLPFEIDRFIASTGKTAGGEDFLQINPKGYVPTIRMDDGGILTEGGAVLQYIADQNPASGLAPKPAPWNATACRNGLRSSVLKFTKRSPRCSAKRYQRK